MFVEAKKSYCGTLAPLLKEWKQLHFGNGRSFRSGDGANGLFEGRKFLNHVHVIWSCEDCDFCMLCEKFRSFNAAGIEHSSVFPKSRKCSVRRSDSFQGPDDWVKQCFAYWPSWLWAHKGWTAHCHFVKTFSCPSTEKKCTTPCHRMGHFMQRQPPVASSVRSGDVYQWRAGNGAMFFDTIAVFPSSKVVISHPLLPDSVSS